MQHSDSPARGNFKPRKVDRRKSTPGEHITFPLHLPDGEIIKAERRQSPDRRSNSYISKQALFRGVTWDLIEPHLDSCPVRKLESGEILLSPMKVNEHLYLVRSGRLLVHLDSPESEGKYPIETGDFTGDISIIDGNAPSAYVVAEVPTEVLAIHKDIFWNKVATDAAVVKNMLGMFVERVRFSNQAALEALEKELRFQHLQKELQAAHNIQMSLLPKLPLFNDLNQVKAHAIMHAARDVGGDFFDALAIDDHRIYMAVGDVSGKGMPAALFMTRTITLLRDCIFRGCGLDLLASSVNNSLCENNDTNMFTTAFIAVLDIRSGELSYISGGHNPTLIGNRRNGFDYLDQPKGILMGVMEDSTYQVLRRKMQPGETLVIYTDGVTEAENIEKDMFGDEPFRELLGTLPSDHPEELVNGVRKKVARHAGAAPQSDDITIFALHYQGN